MSRLHRRFDEDTLTRALAAAGLAGARSFPALDGYGVIGTATRP